MHESSTDRRRSCFAGSDLLNLEQVAFIRAIDTDLNGYLRVVFHKQRRAKSDVFDVVGAKLDFHQHAVLDLVLARLEIVQRLAFTADRNAINAVEAAAVKLDTDET